MTVQAAEHGQKQGSGASKGPCVCECFGFTAISRITKKNGDFEGFHLKSMLEKHAKPLQWFA